MFSIDEVSVEGPLKTEGLCMFYIERGPFKGLLKMKDLFNSLNSSSIHRFRRSSKGECYFEVLIQTQALLKALHRQGPFKRSSIDRESFEGHPYIPRNF